MAADVFEYAVLRLVPRVERGERINVGVVLFCRTRHFLGIRFALDAGRRAALQALAPEADIEAISGHLEALGQIVRGDPSGGSMAALAPPERFRWVVSPSSTMIQPSDVHAGVTDDPDGTLNQIFASQIG